MAYCTVQDLLTGNIPTPAYIDKQKFVDDAADEIDSRIGFLYQTPVLMPPDPNAITSRPVQLLLKRLNVFIATGRLLLAADAGGEDSQVHAYGLYLLKEADATLKMIETGDLVLEDVPPVTTGGNRVNGPIIYNKDPESSVEAFYDRIANPFYIFPYPAEVPIYPRYP